MRILGLYFVNSLALCLSLLSAGKLSAQSASGQVAVGAATARTTSSARIGVQGRFDALNLVGSAELQSNGLNIFARSLFVPIVTPGVRFLDDRFYLGLGIGLGGYSDSDDDGDEISRSGFSLSPLAMYDVYNDRFASLSLGGWFNFLFVGETERCNNNRCVEANDDAFGIGMNLGAGIRGKLTPGLAIGSEFGWGFISVSQDNGNDLFFHGLFGTILFEASVGV